MNTGKFKVVQIFIAVLSQTALFAAGSAVLDFDLNIQFDHITYDDGLVILPMTNIQDHMGFIWFGTALGPIRYDGYEFRLFSPYDEDAEVKGHYLQDICEDHDGNIWIAQHGNGVSKLDRETGRFTHFCHDPDDSATLSTDVSGAFFLDSRDNLWVVSVELQIPPVSFLDRLDTKTGHIRRYRHDPENPNSVSDKPIYPFSFSVIRQIPIKEDRNANVWVGTYGGGVNRYNHQRDDFTCFVNDPENPESLSSDYISTITVSASGDLWLCTWGGGLNLFDPKTESFVSHRHDPQDDNSPASDTCYTIFEDHAGKLWISVPSGLDRYDPKTRTFEHFCHDPDDPSTLTAGTMYLPVYEDVFENVWILAGYDGHHLNVFDPATGVFHRFPTNLAGPTALHAFNFFSLLIDYSGAIWIGSLGNILNRTNTGSNRFLNLRKNDKAKHSLLSDTINCLLQSQKEKGIIWIGTAEGLSKLDWEKGRFEHYVHDPSDLNSLSDHQVRSLCEDRDGNLWLGTGNGVDRLDESGIFTHYVDAIDDTMAVHGERIRKVIYDEEGYIWAFPWVGRLSRMDIKTASVRRFQRDPDDSTSINSFENEVYSILQDKYGTIWVGAMGLNRYNPGCECFTRYIENCAVTEIFEDRRGNLWLGTMGMGLGRFDRDTGEAQFFTHDALVGGTIQNIIDDDDGLLWITTDLGLVRFNPQDTTSFRVRKEHGIPEDRYLKEAIRLRNGQILLATQAKGLILFDPRAVRRNQIKPRVVISDIKVDNVSVQFGEGFSLYRDVSILQEIHFTHDQNDISFVCAALHYVQPGQNRYRFWLENYDDGWYDAGTNRVATYTNLDPGKYEFHVKASNSDGVWNDEGVSLRVIIHPPWHATVWAYGFYVLGTILIVIAVWKNQVRRITLRNDLKLKQVEADQLQEIDHMKTRFLANISHEFRTPLTLILGPIKLLLKKIQQADLHTELEIMQRNARRLSRLVNQLLDLSKIEAGSMTLRTYRDDLVSFINRIVQSFESRAKLKAIRLTFGSRPSSLPVYFDHEKIENIFYNLIANALKFTPSKGSVNVTLQRADKATLQNLMDKSKSFAEGAVSISVVDTGIGIPEDHLDKIFDRFYQVEGSNKREDVGTGIGLSLVKELVEMHHGYLNVDSESDRGTTFTVYLPLGRAHLRDEEVVLDTFAGEEAISEEEPGDVAGRQEEQKRPDRQIPSVLVVEDNADLRHYIRGILKGDYRIIEADDGRTGLDIALQKMPDLVITDVMMPEMDGFELCEQLKTGKLTSHIPIIMLTARADLKSKIHGLETGADDYLIKPFDETELAVRVDNLIQQRQKLRRLYSNDILIPLKDISVTSADERFLQRAAEIITEHIHSETFGPSSFCLEVGLSRSQLHRKLKAIVAMSTTEFIRSIRLRYAADLLKHKYGTIAEIAYEVGFNNPAYFSDCFRKQFGCLPSEYKSSGSRDQ